MSSKRLPGKVIAPICGSTVLELTIERVSKSVLLDDFIVATSVEQSDDILVEYVPSEKIYRGSLTNVRSRFVEIAQIFNPKNVIRITADCPLICYEMIDDAIRKHEKTGADYTANCNVKSYPKGFDVEVFRAELLFDRRSQTTDGFEIEHVTPWMYRSGMLNVANIEFKDWRKAKKYNFSIDAQSDLDFVRSLAKSASIETMTFSEIWSSLV
jgi:spore coat polysaccharide biosynthesis protein SpsF (cytidylyltransferase family)